MSRMPLLLTVLIACGGKDAPETAPPTTPTETGAPPTESETESEPVETADPSVVPLDGVCTFASRWGSFYVDETLDYAYVTGVVNDGVVPISILTNVTSDGECTIWRRENPYCSPSCEPGFTCDFDGTCIPYPVGQDIGTVTVDGLVQPSSMEPLQPGNTYFDVTLPNPPWAPGDLVTLDIEGGVFEPVRLHGVAPEPLDVVSSSWAIQQGQPFTLAWDPPEDGARTEVVLSLSIDLHGVTPSSVECRFADDGEGTVSASVLETLMSYGITGFPMGNVVRRTADSAPIGGGCVDLIASSTRFGDVTIEGYTPCNRDEECPKGQTCNEELQRCE